MSEALAARSDSGAINGEGGNGRTWKTLNASSPIRLKARFTP
jgi:hypothetical protein